jgi:hypothetical protein
MDIDSSHAHARSRRRPGDILLRSLLPLAALVLLLSTLWVGPWGFLIGCIAWWNIVRRIR